MKLTHQLKEEREGGRKKKERLAQNENGYRMEEKKLRMSYTTIGTYL